MISNGKTTKIALLKELKEQFKNTKFSAKSDYTVVRISWIDGDNEEEVEKIARKYEYGHFDGMIDMYEYDDVNETLPQCKYIFCTRTISPELLSSVHERINKEWGNILSMDEKSFMTQFQCWKEQFVNSYIRNNNI